MESDLCLVNYFWAWGLFWSAADTPSDTSLKKADLSRSQSLWNRNSFLARGDVLCCLLSCVVRFYLAWAREGLVCVVSVSVSSYVSATLLQGNVISLLLLVFHTDSLALIGEM